MKCTNAKKYNKMYKYKNNTKQVQYKIGTKSARNAINGIIIY